MYVRFLLRPSIVVCLHLRSIDNRFMLPPKIPASPPLTRFSMHCVWVIVLACHFEPNNVLTSYNRIVFSLRSTLGIMQSNETVESHPWMRCQSWQCSRRHEPHRYFGCSIRITPVDVAAAPYYGATPREHSSEWLPPGFSPWTQALSYLYVLCHWR